MVQICVKGVGPELRAEIEAAAKKEGMTMSAWVRKTILRAAERTLNPPEVDLGKLIGLAQDVAALSNDALEQQRKMNANVEELRTLTNTAVIGQHRLLARVLPTEPPE